MVSLLWVYGMASKIAHLISSLASNINIIVVYIDY